MRALILLLLVPGIAWAASGDNGISGGGSATNKSGTITSGSTSQPVLATNPARVGCEIQPLTTDMWVAIDGTAANTAGSFFVPSGSLYRCAAPSDIVPTGRISIWSTTAGAAFTAVEYSR